MNDMTITTGTELAVLPRASLPTILAADDKDIFGTLARELADFEPDATTPQGRAEIGSKARKVGEAKMDLVRLANGLTEGWRKQTAAVVVERKIIEERMDGLRKQIEAPRDEYNAREANRVKAHEAALAEFVVAYPEDGPASEIAGLIDFVTDLHVGRDWQEFARKAAAERALSLQTLRDAYQHAKTREDEAEAQAARDAEETERRRLEAIEAQRLREEQIAAEAAERATREAEEAAERKADEARRAAQAALDAAEVERVRQVEEATRREREAAEALARAEAERLAAEDRERAAAQMAEAARVAAEQKAARDAEAAVEAERQRATKEQQLADYHRSMLQHVKNCGFGFIGPDPQPLGILQYELTDKIKYDEENFGDLLAEALIARDAALAMIQKSVDDSNRRHAEEAERARVAREAEAQRKKDEERAANKAHQAKINNEVLDGLMDAICEVHSGNAVEANAICRAIIVAVAKGQVKHLKLEY